MLYTVTILLLNFRSTDIKTPKSFMDFTVSIDLTKVGSSYQIYRKWFYFYI